jgi:hypothetical protein
MEIVGARIAAARTTKAETVSQECADKRSVRRVAPAKAAP